MAGVDIPKINIPFVGGSVELGAHPDCGSLILQNKSDNDQLQATLDVVCKSARDDQMQKVIAAAAIGLGLLALWGVVGILSGTFQLLGMGMRGSARVAGRAVGTAQRRRQARQPPWPPPPPG